MHLSEYMELIGVKDPQVAEAIGRTRPTVSRIRRKLVRPDWETINRITAWSRGAVSASDFAEIEKRESAA